MNGLADIAVHYFCTILFSDDSNIDSDFAVREMESFSEFVSALNPEERIALSAAAKRALDFMLRPPDEYGYHPASIIPDDDDEKRFLESLASGEIYGQW